MSPQVRRRYSKINVFRKKMSGNLAKGLQSSRNRCAPGSTIRCGRTRFAFSYRDISDVPMLHHTMPR
jgi:hypothetical protein